MKLFILFISVFALTTENSFSMGRGRTPDTGGGSEPTPTPVVVPTPSNEDLGTGGISVKINEATNFTDYQMTKVNGAAELLRTVLNSEEFKQKVLHHRYLGKEAFEENLGLTNLQIYNKMMEAAEALPLQTEANHVLDFYAATYYTSKGVIGYTNQNTRTVYMNTRFLNMSSYTAGDVAANILHEWMHKLGFDHDFNSTGRRPCSVPYGIGNIVDNITAGTNDIPACANP